MFCGERNLNPGEGVRLQLKGMRKHAGERQRMKAVEQALRSNVADHP